MSVWSHPKSRHWLSAMLIMSAASLSVACTTPRPVDAPSVEASVSVEEEAAPLVLEGPWFVQEPGATPARCMRGEDEEIFCEQGGSQALPQGTFVKMQPELSRVLELTITDDAIWVGTEISAVIVDGVLAADEAPGALHHGPLYMAISEAVDLRVRTALLAGEEPEKRAILRLDADVPARIVLQLMYTALQAGVEQLAFGMPRELTTFNGTCEAIAPATEHFPFRWSCVPSSAADTDDVTTTTRLRFVEHQWADVFSPTIDEGFDSEPRKIPTRDLRIVVTDTGFKLTLDAEELPAPEGLDYKALYQAVVALAEAHPEDVFQAIVLPAPGMSAQTFLKTFDVVSFRMDATHYDSSQAFEEAWQSAGDRSRLFDYVVVGVVQ